LFWGGELLQKLLSEGVANAPPTTAPLDAVVAALEDVAPELERRREHAKARSVLIAAHPELRERELIKLTSLASAVAAALRARRVAELAASLTAEAGIAIFKIGFERWINDPKGRLLSQHIRASHDQLKAVIAGNAIPGTERLPSRTTAAPRTKSPTRRRG
jgi:hypothetical protein